MLIFISLRFLKDMIVNDEIRMRFLHYEKNFVEEK